MNASAWSTWTRRLLGPSLDGPMRAAFEAEDAETNRRRLRVLLPLVVVGHLAHVAMFHLTPAERATLAPHLILWREGLLAVHAATAAFAAVLAALALRSPRDPASRHLGTGAAALYVLHGAAVSGVDQLSVTSVTPFVGYCLGAAVVVCLTPRAAGWIYLVGGTVFFALVYRLQPSPSARLATLPDGVSISCISLTLALLAHAARRRDFLQRRTIDEQREALQALNADLERRVSEQVSEIVARADEVNRLNAQLTAQVQERSEALSRALAQLERRAERGVLRRGTVLVERFELDRMIGEGGMGFVYSGTDRSTGMRVAVKIIQSRSSSDLQAMQRFLREVRTASRVSHPAVVRMLHVDVSEDGTLFQVQELVDGETLEARLQDGRTWDPAVVARVGSVLSEALAAAHAQGVVHRDVKPSNVMLTRTAPGLKLLDFGISKLYAEAAEKEGETRTGVLVGTPAFMSPEQLDRRGDVTDRADVYATGLLLYTLLAGRLPVEGGLPLAVSSASAPDVRAARPEVPAELASVVAQCLARSARERLSAEALASALAGFADRRQAPALEALEQQGRLHDAETVAARNVRTVVVERTA